MVMSTEPQEADKNIEIIEPVVPEVEQEEAPLPEPETGEAPVTEETPPGETPSTTEGEPAVAESTPAEQPPAPQFAQAPPPVDQKAIDELQQRRAADKQREWQDTTTRRAQAYERQLNEAGYLPEQSRDLARRYYQQEQRFKKQEDETSEMLGYIQGRQAAAIHYMKQHGLANQQMLNDLADLQRANTPEEMEREALRMKRERALIAENARLKQGRVQPQTFDNSQGAAEVTSNVDRLLEAYNNGDRSEAAVKAARRLAMGS
jgi:hypothetical protein